MIHTALDLVDCLDLDSHEFPRSSVIKIGQWSNLYASSVENRRNGKKTAGEGVYYTQRTIHIDAVLVDCLELDSHEAPRSSVIKIGQWGNLYASSVENRRNGKKTAGECVHYTQRTIHTDAVLVDCLELRSHVTYTLLVVMRIPCIKNHKKPSTQSMVFQ